MKLPTRIPLRLAIRRLPVSSGRSISTTVLKPANVAPIVGTGPPPEPPVAAGDYVDPRIARRRRQAEMLQQAREIRASESGTRSDVAMKRRFWKNVTVQEADGALQVNLDSRPLRHPKTKSIVQIPTTKPHLATALAIEWDLLTSTQQALRHHLIPLTSLVCRAIDIRQDDAAAASSPDAAAAGAIRTQIATTLLRYLDTDSLLCWAPPAGPYDTRNDAGESLRDVQKRTAEEIVGFVTGRVWPGVSIGPVLDGHSIMPRRLDVEVKEVVRGWLMGLDAWELAGLERAALAGKSLITAVRLVVEWSEGAVGQPARTESDGKFGVEEAARATSLEVNWQTGRWGEVEDTHDVEKEDIRRQLGSVVLLVSGAGRK